MQDSCQLLGSKHRGERRIRTGIMSTSVKLYAKGEIILYTFIYIYLGTGFHDLDKLWLLHRTGKKCFKKCF